MGAYLNNAATTFPKPPAVLAAVTRFLAQPPRDAGRSSGDAGISAVCRRELADLFGLADAQRVVLLPSATYALNLVVQGLLSPGHVSGRLPVHAITTALEHNSLLRPLEHLRRKGTLELSFLHPEDDGRVHPEAVAAELRPNTRLIAITHASNVTGWIQPVEEVASLVAGEDVAVLIDASQSAGAVDLNYAELPGRVFVAMAGHKGLFGPMGTGALLVPDATLPQTIVGGTGVRSDSPLHPAELPLRHEAGTPNLPGIAGFTEGLRFVREQTVAKLGSHRQRLVRRLRAGLADVPGVRLAPLPKEDGRAGIVAFTLSGWDAGDLGYTLMESFAIETRAGLHCAPRIHDVLDTLPDGNVRASVAAFNTEGDIEQLIAAVKCLAEAPCAV